MEISSPFPPNADIHFFALSSEQFTSTTLLPEEIQFAETFRARHKSEFLLGRAAARQALMKQDHNAAQLFLAPDTHGVPKWPNGTVGCISHSHGIAVAAVALASKYTAIGVDIERRIERSLKFVSRIASPTERNWIFETPGSELTRALTIFSAKESIYKALFPLCRQFFGFDAVELTPVDDKTLRATLLRTLSDDFPIGFAFPVHAYTGGDYITTGVALGPPVGGPL